MLTLRPQPIGIYAGPLGALLVPECDHAHEHLPKLLCGDYHDLPPSWQFYLHTLTHDPPPPQPSSLLGRFNAFVLDPTEEKYAALCQDLYGDERVLLDIVAFRFGYFGYVPTLPYIEEAASVGVTGEIFAYLLAAHADVAFAEQQVEQGLMLLEKAIAEVEPLSPAFAARLYNQWASLAPLSEQSKRLRYLEKAIALLENTHFQDALAHTQLQLGSTYQEYAEGQRGLLLKAAQAYQAALQVLRADYYSADYALAQMNLATCYLSMPMEGDSAKLRPAIAVQSLREALKVFTRDTHPHMWASATLNLANALQHAPSSHPEDNLWEAVNLYEEVLEVRREDHTSASYARVLANQGNALAHLGAFSQAVPRLGQAAELFATCGEHGAAQAVRDVLAEIEARRIDMIN